MPKYIINTEKMTISPYEDPATELSIGERLYNLFSSHTGVKEYGGIVGDIQKWYYGSLVKSPWCATAVSYFANKVGLALHAENVNVLRVQCKQLADAGMGYYYDKNNLPIIIKKGDILFWLLEGETMSNSSKKHTGVCAATTTKKDAAIPCIGGNQDDKICVKSYATRQLYAVYRP